MHGRLKRGRDALLRRCELPDVLDLFAVALRLEKSGIICNYQALPDDPSFVESSGIRLGMQEMTRFGMTEADVPRLAELMAAVIIEGKDMSGEVAEYRRRFDTMKFCLPASEAAGLGARLLASVLPRDDYGKAFAENLAALGG